MDPGLDNLLTGVTNTGKSFIIDGRRLKSINQWFNKQNAKLQSIRDKQHIERTTKLQKAIARKRNNRVEDYLNKTARLIINFCLAEDTGNLIIGYNTDFQRGSNIGRKNNQNFVNIPYGRLYDKLSYLCEMYGINFIKQEESYTSKASFWDKDPIPVYDPKDTENHKFSGKRIHRGIYRTAEGKLLNADINGALNILRKSSIVSLEALYSRGEVDTPIRIRIA